MSDRRTVVTARGAALAAAPRRRPDAAARAARWMLACVAVLAVALSGCAYFNTFYYAKTMYRQAFPTDRDAYIVGFRVSTDLTNNTQSASASSMQKAALDSTLLRCRKIWTAYASSGLVDDAYLLAGKAYYGKGQYERAVPALRTVIDSFPKSDLVPEATAFLGATYLQLKDVQRGRDLLEGLLVAHPKFRQRDLVSFVLGVSYRDDKRWDEAARAFLDVVDHFSKSDVWNDAAFQAGYVLGKEKRWAEARAAYLHVGKKRNTAELVSVADERRRNARLAVGDTYMQEKNYADAERIFRSIYGELLQPQTTDRDIASRARLRIAECRQGAGDYDGALQQLQYILDDVNALALQQGSGGFSNNVWAAEAQYDIGYILEVYKRDIPGARLAYAQVKKFGTESQFAVRAASRTGNLQRLTSLRAKKDKSDPAEQALSAAELLLFDLEKPADAITQYEVVERRYPHSDFARKAAFARGWAQLSALNDTTAALASFTRVLQRYPGTVYAEDARSTLARLGVTAPDSTPSVLDDLVLARDSIAVVDSLRPFEAVADSMARADAIADSLAAAVQKAHDDSVAAVQGGTPHGPPGRPGREDEDFVRERMARERGQRARSEGDSLAPPLADSLGVAPRDSVPPDSGAAPPDTTSSTGKPSAPPPSGAPGTQPATPAPAAVKPKTPASGKPPATRKPGTKPPVAAPGDSTAARRDSTTAPPRDTTAAPADTSGAHR